jgi:hypothetical protein
MGHGADQIFSVSIASGATLSGAADLGRAWGRVYLEIRSMISNSQHYIQGSSDNSTFRRVYFDSLNSSTVGTNLYVIASAVSNGIVPAPPGIQYLKVETTATADSGQTYKIICSDEA